MKTKAWVLYDPGKMELREFEVGKPQADQILIKTKVTSVCASDPKIFEGSFPGQIYPIIMGHEFAGKVVSIGRRAALVCDLKEGDRITVEPRIPCNQCEWCRTEFNYHRCENTKAYGMNLLADQAPGLFGAYAEYLYLLPGTIIYKLPSSTSYLAASLSSVIANGVRWIKNLGQMTFGQTLAISGVGSQGLATLIAAREFGVGPIAIIGLARDEARFQLAREFGADYVVNLDKEDPLEAVPTLLGDRPDVVVETSGVPSAIQTALKLVKPSGRVVVIGLSGGKETPIKFDLNVFNGVTIACDYGQAGNGRDAMRIINSGKYDIGKINNSHYSLEQMPQALKDAANPPKDFIKAGIVF